MLLLKFDIFQRTLKAGKLNPRILKVFVATGNEEILSMIRALNIQLVLTPILPTSKLYLYTVFDIYCIGITTQPIQQNNVYFIGITTQQTLYTILGSQHNLHNILYFVWHMLYADQTQPTQQYYNIIYCVWHILYWDHNPTYTITLYTVFDI